MRNVKGFKVLMRWTYSLLFLGLCVGFLASGSLLENVASWFAVGIVLLILHIVLLLATDKNNNLYLYYSMFSIAYMMGLGIGFMISSAISLVIFGVVILLFQLLVVERR